VTTAMIEAEDFELASAVVEVRDTAVGRGVFAARKFRKGELLGEIDGQVILDPDYSSDYCMDLGEDYSLEPDPPFRYLNHSCEPNAELFQYVDDDEEYVLRMWIQAIRKIRKREQITIDYSWPAEEAITCLCGASKCRGWIVDPAELKMLKKMKKRERKGKVKS